MYLLSLLFIFVFLLLLALVSLSLPYFIVLVYLVYNPIEYVSEIDLILLNHTPMIHVVAILFLVLELIYSSLNCYYFQQQQT